MGNLTRKTLFFLTILTYICSHIPSSMVESISVDELPLSTKSRWIVNNKGQRVKLSCVNWVTHLEPVLAEGLSKQPVDKISKMIKDMGFNCVRFTYPIHLPTRESLASLTVAQSFTRLGLLDTLAGIQENNPTFVDLTLIDAYQAVVGSLGNHGLMVILDNHLSKPGWCCKNLDDNGFFGDEHFKDPEIWIQGLSNMATLFKPNPHVVAMSLRNELRGPKQNPYDWYRYMQRGAEAVHAANPNVLVLLGGLSYDTDLSFLKEKQVTLSFRNKLVEEVHRYSFTNDQNWTNVNANEVCGNVLKEMMNNSGFILKQNIPLAVTEFGVHLEGATEDDRRFFNCILTWIAEHDLDFAYWALQGTYYLRQGGVDMNETFGLLDMSWSKPKNPSFVKRFSLVQSPLQGPGLGKEKHYKIFHPETGLCVTKNPTTKPRKVLAESITLGPCDKAHHWMYNRDTTITLIDSPKKGLQAQGLGHKVRVGPFKSDLGTKWIPISDSKLHLSTTLDSKTRVCLDLDSKNNVITNECKCLEEDASCDPMNQWFKIVPING